MTVEENQYTNAAPIVLFNQYSRVCIYKVDSETNKPLSGAEFTLYDAETEKEVQTVISDSKGYAEFKDVKPGEYYVKETNAPAGYQISEEKIYIDTSKTNYTMAAPIVMKNTPDTPDTPHTGDSFPIFPAAITAGLSMIGLITVLILKKKRK